jgi:hypothetical protein
MNLIPRLTDAELKAAIRCAEKYPPGHGTVLLAFKTKRDYDVGSGVDVERALREKPGLVRFG